MAAAKTKGEAPREDRLAGAARALAMLPALGLALLALAPPLAARGMVPRHSLIAAAALAGTGVMLWLGARAPQGGKKRAPWVLRFEPRRVHYMQALTQSCVYLWWGSHWGEVGRHVWLIALQLLLAYQVELLISLWRGRPWSGGFGPLPICFSVNLFLWFRDERFIWQLALIALCYLGKELIRWERLGPTGGKEQTGSRHVFNPSSFGLAIASIVLLASGTTGATWAREIALTQEEAPHMWEALFAVGLIVQLQFPVVLVTMSAAITTWLCATILAAAFGAYPFVTTDLPAAVFLGMLLLVTDPATSPASRSGKVLFGAGYGLLVVLLFYPLEAWGGHGYFDKLLPVPILNLLVPRLEKWGGALDRRLSRFWERAASNFVHVGTWAAVFGAMYLGKSFGPSHPGHDIGYWQRACEARPSSPPVGPTACQTLLNLLARACQTGNLYACHNMGVELDLAAGRGKAVPAGASSSFYERACAGGIAESCAALGRAPGAEPY